MRGPSDTARAPLPAWLVQGAPYRPPRDRDAFLDRTAQGFLHLLALARRRPLRRTGRTRADPTVRIVCALGFALLVALARSPGYLALAAATFLVLLALQPAKRIAATLRAAAVGAGLTGLVLIPYAMAAGPSRPLLLVLRVALSTGAVALLASSTEWTSLSTAARRLRVPALFVLVLDVTVRYIGLLGELALEMTQALRLRSVGRNPDKRGALGGVAGTLFLRSRELAEELHMAMTCRCFTGEFHAGDPLGFERTDAALLVVIVGLTAALAVWPVAA